MSRTKGDESVIPAEAGIHTPFPQIRFTRPARTAGWPSYRGRSRVLYSANVLHNREHFNRMEDGDVSFLRKQEARLLCACSCGPGGPSGTLGYFLDSRLRGNDNQSVSGYPGEQSFFNRLKCYRNSFLRGGAHFLFLWKYT